MQGKQLESGDQVAWRTGADKATGCVLRKATCRLGVSGKIFNASPKAPRILVRRDDNGELAVLTPGDLRILRH